MIVLYLTVETVSPNFAMLQLLEVKTKGNFTVYWIDCTVFFIDVCKCLHIFYSTFTFLDVYTKYLILMIFFSLFLYFCRTSIKKPNLLPEIKFFKNYKII